MPAFNFAVILINHNLSSASTSKSAGYPLQANRVEKSVCLDKTVARIINLYVGNVSGDHTGSPLRNKINE